MAIASLIALPLEGVPAATWPDAMLELRAEVTASRRETEEVSVRQGLDNLRCSPWHDFELAIFRETGPDAWPYETKPLHEYDSAVEQAFKRDGLIDLKKEYLSAVRERGKNAYSRFRKTVLRDGSFWSSPDRFRNRITYYYRSIDVPQDRSVDIHLGFNEGCKAFLNGKEAFSEFVAPARKCVAYQASVTLDLRKGTNHLLLKLTSYDLHPERHQTCFSFNPVAPVDVKERTLQLFKDFPRQTDWFYQDLKRMLSAPLGADLNEEGISKNMVAWLKADRDTTFEQQLLQGVVTEVTGKAAFQKQLDDLIAKNAAVMDRGWLELYVEACEARRAQRLAKMRKQFPRTLFVKRKMLRPSFYGYTEGLSCANFEMNFEPGSALCLLEWEDGEPKVTELLKDDDGVFRDPDVSWDGTRILFAWKKDKNKDDFHLYEMSWPDREVRQLTYGLSVADFEGRYLPNGDIVFSSSRGVGTTDCWTTETSNMHTCDKEGKYLRRLGYDQVVTCHPSLLENGSVIYTRWDYNDRGQVFPQALFSMNPDGTAQTEYYGNNSWFPTVINHARGIPGTGKVLAVVHGHHTWQAGELAIIDRSKGTQETKGVKIIAPPRKATGDTRGFSYERDKDGWIEPGRGPQNIAVDRYGQNGNLHRHPYPLDETSFLVAMTPYMNARNEGKRLGIRFHLYWMDIDGHRELLAYDPAVSSAHPIPLAPRRRPYVRPSVVDHAVPTGTYFMQDIHEGPGLKGVERGTVKKLRVVEIEYRALKIGENHSGGRGGGGMSSSPISTGNGAWDVKKILGEAKVHEDGSAMFKVPANTPVYFQAIDGNGSMVQTMRSWSTLMPNETSSCVGCHEDKDYALPVTRTTLAMNAGAQDLVPFYGPARGFSFLKEIQPILNTKCTSCHDGKTEKNGKVLMDLTDKRIHDKVSKRGWATSYLNLTHSTCEARGGARGNADDQALNWVSSQSVPSMIPPYFRGSARSGWFKRLRKGHGKMSRNELDRFAAWIDLGVPFCGDYVEANAWTDDEFTHYMQMQRKRERLAAEVRENSEALGEKQTGQPVALPTAAPRYTDYMKTRGITEAAVNRGYRNLALNPDGRRGEFPKATSNSVCRNQPQFRAANVIDGKTDNKGHGKARPSWGPDQLDDLWLKIDLGKQHDVDKVVVTIRADFPHDSWWKSGTLEFSDGSSLDFTLKKKDSAQTIAFPPRKVSWVKFTNLVAAELKWCGWTEVGVWGR